MIEEAARDRFPNSDICREAFEAGATWAFKGADHFSRSATMLEKLRDTIGHGYGEGDIEAITRIVVARLKDWDRLTMFDGNQSYTLTEPLVAAVEATKGRIVTIGVLTDLHMQLNRTKL
jgi:hypothetical protein